MDFQVGDIIEITNDPNYTIICKGSQGTVKNIHKSGNLTVIFTIIYDKFGDKHSDSALYNCVYPSDCTLVTPRIIFTV